MKTLLFQNEWVNSTLKAESLNWDKMGTKKEENIFKSRCSKSKNLEISWPERKNKRSLSSSFLAKN